MNSKPIIPPEIIINKYNFLFLYSLLKSIFIFDKEDRKKKNDKLESILIKIKDNYNITIKREYSKENFENIVRYVKTQNIKYPGEILEIILLRLFSSIMKVPQNETINKYIYYNLQNLYGINNKPEEIKKEEINYIQNFILYEKILPEELKNKEIFFQPYNIIHNTLDYFLCLIYKLKIETIKNHNKKFEKQYNETSYNLYINSINKNGKEEKNITKNNIISFENIIDKILDYYKGKKQNDNNNNIISYFFFTLFFNYQIINCRLLNYNKNLSGFSRVPYEYNLKGSSMKGYYAILVSSSMRQDDRIKSVVMIENDLMELGMAEFGKTIIFNPYIKSFNYNKNRLYTYYFYYLTKACGTFENNTVEELNFYNNFLRDNVDDYLCEILQTFKNLKTLNISNNKLCSGISKFLNKLKLLYRHKKSKLENLNINKCFLDAYSIYELSECLKSRYCKLKSLYLNINYLNDYNSDILFKAIKKNSSLKKLYLSRNVIGNSSTDKIARIISRFHESLEVIYLSQNEIRNSDNLLRIAFRTKVIYCKEEDKNKVLLDENFILKNLDISKNGVNFRNREQILLLKELLKDTYLSCLDYSIILKDDHHETFESQHYKEYNKEIEELKNKLIDIKNKRNKLFEYIEECKSIQNKYNFIFEKYINNKDLNDILIETIKDNNIFQIDDDIENFMSEELLNSIGKKKEDLLDEENYYFTNNLIKYMLLYKVNGGLINQWLKGGKKCMIII